MDTELIKKIISIINKIKILNYKEIHKSEIQISSVEHVIPSKKIGYDYDGVITMKTKDPDFYGQRHSNTTDVWEFMKNKILKEQSEGHKIYIISANSNAQTNTKFLNPIDGCYGKQCIEKHIEIKKFDLDEFYDDSPLMIYKIMKAKKEKYFKKDLKVFIVHPGKAIYEVGKADNIKIMTYNLCWENLSGIKDKVLNTNCIMNKVMNKDVNLCKNNIEGIINDNGPFDFIGLQEASENHFGENIIFLANNNNYKFIYNNNNNGGMYTLYNNKKYILISYIIYYFDDNRGRPWISSIFKNICTNKKICVINVHCGHYRDYSELSKRIDEIQVPKDYEENTRIIMLGDFNNFKYKVNKITWDNKQLYELFSYETFVLKKGTGYIDHIFDSENKIIYNKSITPNDDIRIKDASDHLPLVVELLA